MDFMDWHRRRNDNVAETYSEGGQVRVNREGELVYLTFPLLEKEGWVNHLFTTRLGGVSEGMYSTLNVSYT